MGVPLSQISSTLNVFMGSEYVNDFDFNNRTYRVYVQADQPFRMHSSDLHSYYVRSDTGQMVPLDNLVTVQESAGPPVITHYNLFRAVEIDGSAAPGYSSGQALTAMEDLAKQNMMPGMTYEWTGLTLDEIESSGKALIIFGLGIRGRLSHAFGAVRKLCAAVHHPAGGTHGRAGRAGPCFIARACK